MFFILEGTGELRFGSERHPIRALDVIACPTGGEVDYYDGECGGEADA